MRKVLACIVCIMVVVCGVPAFGAGFSETQSKAQKGDAQAQYDLGMMYYTGKGTDKNFSEAFRWWLKAANQGHARAQGAVGALYDNGEGVKMNKLEAGKWFLKAAENGDITAQNTVALFYNTGAPALGFEQNKAESEKWYRRVFVPREHLSQDDRLILAVNYEFGLGVKQDKTKALEMYKELAEEGHATGQVFFGNSYYYAEDYTEAAKWYRKAAEQDYPGSYLPQSKLGDMYRDGKGVKQDYGEAGKWYFEAAERGAKQYYEDAAKCYQKAAEKGSSTAQYNLGVMYYNGYGVKKDTKQALNWWQKAQKQGNVYAANAIKAHKKSKAIKGTDIIKVLTDITDVLTAVNDALGANDNNGAATYTPQTNNSGSNSSGNVSASTQDKRAYRDRCIKCRGSGKIQCPRCKGDGGIYEVIAGAPKYTGKSSRASSTSRVRHTCPKCHGSGIIDCPDCDGKGYTIRTY